MARVLDHFGGPVCTAEMYPVRIGFKNVGKSEGSGIRPYTESDSETDNGTVAVKLSSVGRGSGSAYLSASPPLP